MPPHVGPRFSGVGVAALYVLPAILALDAAYRPAAAWRRIQRHKPRWVVLFLAPGPVGWLVGSAIPAVAVAGFSAFYMAKVRSELDAATALELAASDPSAYPAVRHAEAAAAPLLVGVPVVGFALMLAASATGRERAVALVFAVLGTVTTMIAIAIIRRQSDSAP